MTNNEFMGLLIGAIVTLLAIATAVVTLIVKPLINLNKSITKLNASIDQLNGQSATLNERVTKHGKEIDECKRKLIIHGQEIKHIKEKVK